MKKSDKKRIAIIEGVRTPMGKMGGGLARVQADNLAAHAIREVLLRADFDKNLIDEVIIGNVAGPAHAMNIARVAALKAGIAKHIPAFTVHRNCASGMEAITNAGDKMRAGDGEIFVAGGAESMSNIPLLYNEQAVKFFGNMMKAKSVPQKLAVLASWRPSMFFKPKIGLMLGLYDIISGMGMGGTAEVLAKEYHITRLEQDEYAAMSHNKAEASQSKMKEEIVPLVGDLKKGTIVSEDEGIRKGQTVDKLAKLSTVFDKYHGTVTAGNSSQITDGAAAVIAMSEDKAKELGLKPIGYVTEWAYAGLDPHRMGLGPVYATKRLLEKTGAKLQDFELVEINEAFAAQIIACVRGFPQEGMGELDLSRLNVNGGAIALGHPVGMTGTRLIITLIKELRRQKKNVGLASACIGGGQGGSVMVEIS
jgi:acetyl-CoA acetyltransferase family protein